MGTRIIKNYPAPRLMETIGATNQTTAEAIGELVANCFDAQIADVPMDITIDLRNGMICVIDNGKGMTDEILAEAVRIGEDMSRHMTRSEGAKGHFGMGFKTSCATLGKFYEIYTRPVGEDREYHVEFDIDGFSKRVSGANAWDVAIEDGPHDPDSPLKDAKNGTAFVIRHLRDKDPFVSAILDYLGEAFKGHLEIGDKITIVDENATNQAMPKKPDFIPGSTIPIETCCGLNEEYKIVGWVAIDKQTHNNGQYGFNIYRHKQLVEKWDKSWFRAHLMTSRIIGEVHLDFLDATFYKQGLQQDEVWKMIQKHMKEFLKPVVSASDNISKKGNISDPAALRKIINTMRREYGEEPLEEETRETGNSGGISTTATAGNGEGQGIVIEQMGPTTQTQVQTKPSVKETIKTIVREKSLEMKDGTVIEICYIERENGGTTAGPFDYIYDEDDEDERKARLQIIVYKDHPLWEKNFDRELVKILATSDGIYRALVEKLGRTAFEARTIRNEWLMKRTRKEGSDDE